MSTRRLAQAHREDTAPVYGIYSGIKVDLNGSQSCYSMRRLVPFEFFRQLRGVGTGQYGTHQSLLWTLHSPLDVEPEVVQDDVQVHASMHESEIEPRHEREARVKADKMFYVSGKSVALAMFIMDHGTPEEIVDLETGEVTLKPMERTPQFCGDAAGDVAPSCRALSWRSQKIVASGAPDEGSDSNGATQTAPIHTRRDLGAKV